MVKTTRIVSLFDAQAALVSHLPSFFMNTDTVEVIASIIILGVAIWAASVVIETLAKIVNKLIGMMVAIALLLIYLKISWGIDPASLWHSLEKLPQAFNFST